VEGVYLIDGPGKVSGYSAREHVRPPIRDSRCSPGDHFLYVADNDNTQTNLPPREPLGSCGCSVAPQWFSIGQEADDESTIGSTGAVPMALEWCQRPLFVRGGLDNRSRV